MAEETAKQVLVVLNSDGFVAKQLQMPTHNMHTSKWVRRLKLHMCKTIFGQFISSLCKAKEQAKHIILPGVLEDAGVLLLYPLLWSNPFTP